MSSISRLKKLQERYLSTRLIFVADIFLSCLASLFVVLGANYISQSGNLTQMFLVKYMVTSALASVLLSLLTGTYRIIIRHFSARDGIPFFFVALGKALILLAVMATSYTLGRAIPFILVMDFLLTLFLLLGIRISMIIAYEYINGRIQDRFRHKRVLVYGTTDKSVSVITRLQQSSQYKLIGFLVRSDGTHEILIDRLKVYSFHDEESFSRVVRKLSPDSILFTSGSDVRTEANGVIDYCSRLKVKALIMPPFNEVAESASLLKPREVKVEDLLGREEIRISLNEIDESFRDKVVMVTGAAGSIGSELCRQLSAFGLRKLILFDNGETPTHELRLELQDQYPDLPFVPVIGDVRNRNRLDYVFRTWHPQIVFHAAAYKHVPLMEENPAEAIHVNVIGTRNVADKCCEYGVEKMVMISTDKAVNPTNVMGCSKRIAEIYVQSLGLSIQNGGHPGKTRFVTTRFGNVLGSNGSVIPRFQEQLAQGGPLTVTHPDITRFFMTIPEACRLVMEAAALSEGNQILVFDMGEPVKIDTLARRMITLAGLEPDKDIKIEYTGLRPGEKLYEEVLSDKENTLPSFHERIRIAKVREYAFDEVTAATEKLEALSKKVDIPELIQLMKRLVPEYKSQNSEFEKYDRKD